MVRSHYLAFNFTYLQPPIYVASLAVVEILCVHDDGQQIIDFVDVTCGLCVGEYNALAFADALRRVMQLASLGYRYIYIASFKSIQ